MRVIAGKFRGSVIEAPPGWQTRPITDRVKEALFNIVGHRLGVPGMLPELAVLDLFAGAGSFGIECLSRGARTCLFVERDRKTLRVLRENLKKLRLLDVATVATENAWTMRVPEVAPTGYGLIFVDPPYRAVGDTHRMLDLLERTALRLSTDGLVVFRFECSTPFSPAQLEGLRCVDERTVGRMRLLLFERSDPAGSATDSAAPGE